ncbi:MAG: CNNM domain-containing protein [Ruminococcus sp.]
MIGLILLQIALIALNAIFAGTEIAVISVNETKLEKEVESGNKRAGWLLKMVRNSSGFLATIQVAITLSGFLGAAFASDSFAEKLTWLLQKTGIGISESVLNTISVILVTLIISYFPLCWRDDPETHRHEKMRNAFPSPWLVLSQSLQSCLHRWYGCSPSPPTACCGCAASTPTATRKP